MAEFDGLGDWLQEYKELAGEVRTSVPAMYINNLRRWFAHIENDPRSAVIVEQLHKNAPDIHLWLSEANASRNSDWQGLDWPLQRPDRVSMQLSLFKLFAERIENPTNFAGSLLESPGNKTAQIMSLNSQLFAPLQRDLQVILEKEWDDEILDFEDVPAADRTVTIDHNSKEYIEADAALDDLERAIIQSNEFNDEADKQEKVAEVSALRRILQSTRVRIAAVSVLAMPTLAYISKRFADGILGKLATAAYDKLGALIGMIF